MLIKYLVIAGLLSLPLTSSLEALLPPLYQTADEIAAVVKEHELGNALPSGEPIVGIRKTENGYMVFTTNHQVEATIVYEPATRPGPARFSVKFQTPENINAVRSGE
jgi:hypothetical protein